MAWKEDLPDGSTVTLYVGSEKQSRDPKYDNFEVTPDSTTILDLHIRSITPSDEGIYGCMLLSTAESHSVNLTVEG